MYFGLPISDKDNLDKKNCFMRVKKLRKGFNRSWKLRQIILFKSKNEKLMETI
jgi:hypothetical protein